ncbi:MAG: hypothetical protein ACE148_06260 [Vicinamibacterales bacterium]
MKEHLDLVAFLYRLWGFLSLLVGLALLSLGLGAAALVRSTGGAAADSFAAKVTAAVFLTLAAIVVLWAAVHLLNGRALVRRRRWGRAVALVLAVLDLFLVPFGTALGVYTLWVLMHDDTRSLFEPA